MMSIAVSDIVVFIIIILTVTVCTVRGFALSLYSLLSSLIAVALAFFLRPFVSTGLQKLGVGAYFTDGIYRQLDAARIHHLQGAAVGTGKELSETLHLPGFLKRFLEEKIQNWTVQGSLETIEKDISQTLSSLLVNIISVAALILILLLAMFLLRRVLTFFSKIPVIRQIDRAAGFVLGLILAFFWITMTGMVIQLFSAADFFQTVAADIERSLFAHYFYDTNVFMIFLSKV